MLTLDSFNDSLVRCKDCKKYFQKELNDINSFHTSIFGSCRDCRKQEIIPKLVYEYLEDSEEENRGWQVDRINAYHENELVGFIKISYIPKKRFEHYYKDIFNFLNQIEGKLFLPREYCTTPYREIPLGVLRKHIEGACIAIKCWDVEEFNKIRNFSDQEIIPYYEHLEKLAKTQSGKNFKNFKKYHVDKPLSDYINVEFEYKRLGIATILYKKAYEWMKKKNMNFYGSDMGSNESRIVWSKLEKEFGFEIERTMHYNKRIVRHYLKK